MKIQRLKPYQFGYSLLDLRLLFYTFLFRLVQNADGPRWRNGGNRMFIYQVLFSLGVENDSETVKTLDNTFELETIGQINGHRNFFLPCLIEKYIL